MAILITGGAGFVGSHLADRLIKRGEHVIVCDDLSTGRLANLRDSLRSGSLTFLYADVSQPLHETRTMIRAATNEPLTAIFHLASPAGPDGFGSSSWEALAVNGAGTMAMIDFALEEDARMLFASTSETHGESLVHPQHEEYFENVNPAGPRFCFDEGKRFGEAAMSVAIRERGLQGRIVRIFNCYGPRMGLEDGRVMPAFVSAARDGRPFSMHGSGTQTRSMTYVDDLIDGLLLVVDAEQTAGHTVNLGSEDEVTIGALAQTVADIAGVPLVVADEAARPEDPQRRKPDLRRARALGWSPRVGLRDGLRRTYEWAVTESVEYV